MVVKNKNKKINKMKTNLPNFLLAIFLLLAIILSFVSKNVAQFNVYDTIKLILIISALAIEVILFIRKVRKKNS